jgi:hypothetical protein
VCSVCSVGRPPILARLAPQAHVGATETAPAPAGRSPFLPTEDPRPFTAPARPRAGGARAPRGHRRDSGPRSAPL